MEKYRNGLVQYLELITEFLENSTNLDDLDVFIYHFIEIFWKQEENGLDIVMTKNKELEDVLSDIYHTGLLEIEEKLFEEENKDIFNDESFLDLLAEFLEMVKDAQRMLIDFLY